MARRRRNRGRRRGGGGSTALGLGLIVAALAAFGVIGWLLFTESTRAQDDPDTLCPASGPVAHLAILLDTTDPVSATQLRAARNQIDRLIDDAPDFTRVSFATVSPDAGLRRASFLSICKPPRAASALVANPRLVAEKYDRDFLGKVQAQLDSLLSIPQAETSPIIEALQEFVVAIPGFTTTDVPRDVVLVSDLVQHSDVFSFYRGGDWNSFVASGAVDRMARNMDRVTVRVLRLPRPAVPVEQVDGFWVRYLDRQGAVPRAAVTLGDL